MAMTKEQYEADKQARATLTEQTLKVTAESTPTPTQEENDLLRLGLMHPDDKAAPDNPVMPQLAVQQAMVEKAVADATLAPDQGLPRPPVAGAPTCDDVPTIMGDGAVGATLTCTKGNWTGEPTGFAYQWKRDGANVGASGSTDTYTVQEADSGHSIACVVTATNARGSQTAPQSNAVTINGAAP